MDTLISSGDHAADGRGIPVALTGAREIIQRALIRLSVKKGSFKPDLELGSELYKLCGISSDSRDRIALSYAQEALSPINGIRVLGAACRQEAADSLRVDISLELDGKKYVMEVQA